MIIQRLFAEKTKILYGRSKDIDHGDHQTYYINGKVYKFKPTVKDKKYMIVPENEGEGYDFYDDILHKSDDQRIFDWEHIKDSDLRMMKDSSEVVHKSVLPTEEEVYTGFRKRAGTVRKGNIPGEEAYQIVNSLSPRHGGNGSSYSGQGINIASNGHSVKHTYRKYLQLEEDYIKRAIEQNPRLTEEGVRNNMILSHEEIKEALRKAAKEQYEASQQNTNKSKKNLLKLVKEHPKTSAAIGAGSLLLTGGGIGIYKHIKKRKDKKKND